MQAMPHQEADFLRPIGNAPNGRVPFENQQQYGPVPMQANWGPHQAQMGPQMPQYAGNESLFLKKYVENKMLYKVRKAVILSLTI